MSSMFRSRESVRLTVIRHCATMAIWLAAVLVAGGNICNADENSPAPTESQIKEKVLLYLPDDCQLYAQMNVKPILDSEFVRRFSYMGADPADVFSLPIASWGLSIRDVDRVFFGARQAQAPQPLR